MMNNPLGNYARGAKSLSDDDVNGVIIGTIRIAGRVYYDGKPKSDTLWCDTEDDLIEEAKNLVNDLKTKYKCYPFCFYPDDSKWELRIYP